MDLFVLGMPRSGTSFICSQFSQHNFDFLCDQESIDHLFPQELNPQGYFQRLDLLQLMSSLKLENFDKVYSESTAIENALTEIIQKSVTFKKNNPSKKIALKDPYLLFVFPILIKANMKFTTTKPTIVIVKRDWEKIINSMKKFAKFFKTEISITEEIINNYYNLAENFCIILQLPYHFINLN